MRVRNLTYDADAEARGVPGSRKLGDWGRCRRGCVVPEARRGTRHLAERPRDARRPDAGGAPQKRNRRAGCVDQTMRE